MIIEIPDRNMVVEFPDDMDPKEIERQIYSQVYDQDVISPDQTPPTLLERAKDFITPEQPYTGNDMMPPEPGVAPAPVSEPKNTWSTDPSVYDVSVEEKFDPEGTGYDYESAVSAGMEPDETGHWASRNPKTGQLLKGKKHDTWDLLVKGEADAGYEIVKGQDGKQYSVATEGTFKKNADWINKEFDSIEANFPHSIEGVDHFLERVTQFNDRVEEYNTDVEIAKVDRAKLDKNILAYVPFLAVRALQGVMKYSGAQEAARGLENLKLEDMGASSLPRLTMGGGKAKSSTEKLLIEAAEYWHKELPSFGVPNAGIIFGKNGKPSIKQLDDMPIEEILGATAEGVGFLAPAFVAGKGAAWAVQKMALQARPFFQRLLGGMMAGSLLGEGKKDETLEMMAMFGAFEAGGFAVGNIPNAIKSIRNSTWYRKLTIRERGLAFQSMNEQLRKNPEMVRPEWYSNTGIKPGEKLTEGELARLFPGIKKENIDIRRNTETKNPFKTEGLAPKFDPQAKTREKIDTAVTTQIEEALKTDSLTPEAARILIQEPSLKHLGPQIEELIKTHGAVGGDKPPSVKQTPIGVFPNSAPIEQHLKVKYKDLYGVEESNLPHRDYQAIVDGKRKPETLSKLIEKATDRPVYIEQTKAAIADLLGDLEETYKYEGQTEGQTKEKYVDSLLKAIEVSKDLVPDKKSGPKINEKKGTVPDDTGVMGAVNREFPGRDVKFESESETGFQFTPQSGTHKGMTFAVKTLDFESIKKAIETQEKAPPTETTGRLSKKEQILDISEVKTETDKKLKILSLKQEKSIHKDDAEFVEQIDGVISELESQKGPAPKDITYTIDRNITGKTIKRQKATMLEAVDEAVEKAPIGNGKEFTFDKNGSRKFDIKNADGSYTKYFIERDVNAKKWKLFHKKDTFVSIGYSINNLKQAKIHAESFLKGETESTGTIIFKNKNGDQQYTTKIPNSKYHLRNYRNRVNSSKGVHFADKGGYADTAAPLKSVLELPEIVQLLAEITDGQYPTLKKILKRDPNVLGYFTPKGDGGITLKANIFKDPQLAAYVLSHEIGHFVDYLPHKIMARGNILGRMASLMGYMKHSLPNKKGALGVLTDADRARLKYQAKKMTEAEGAEIWIDEVIRKEFPVTPEDVMAIWRSTEGGIDKGLLDYVKGLNRAQKKAIMKDALKGVVGTELQKFAKFVKTSTGKKIKQTLSDKEIAERLRGAYTDLINAEIKKRRLFDLHDIMKELKALTLAWKPFDPKHDSRYTKYRFSPEELYADAFSVLINKPGMLKSMAPNFYEGFFNYMESKPEFEKVYLKIQNELTGDQVSKTKRHLKHIYKMFEESSQKRQAALIKNRQPATPITDFFMKNLWDKSHAALKVVRSIEKMAVGKDARMAIQELQHTASVVGVYLKDYHTAVLAPIDKLGYDFKELNAQAFYKRIAEGDRGDKANPLGITQPVAQKDLSVIGREIWGEKKFEALEGILKDFRKVRETELYPVLRESGILSPEIMDYIEANKHHVKWDVASHFEKVAGKGYGAKIHKQVGTLGNIDHPIVSTMLQDVSLLRTAIINKSKQEILAALTTVGEAVPAKLDRHKAPKDIPEGKGVLSLFEIDTPGVIKHYEVSKDIADMFTFNPIQAQQLTTFWKWVSQPLRELFVGKNVPWMARNVVRDFQTTVKNVPGLKIRHIPELLYNYLVVAGEVRADIFKGITSPRIRSMRQMRGLPQFRTWSGRDQTFDDEIVRLLTDFRIIPKADNQHNAAVRTVYQMWEYADHMGLMSEVWGKVAADRFIDRHKELGLNTRQKAQVTRELAGTPDAKQRSAQYLILNNLFMFSEMRKSGIRQMFTAFRANKAGYVWKTFVMNVLPKTMKYVMLGSGGAMALSLYLASGGDDEDVINKIKQASRIWDRIPEHDKMMYDCVPLYMTTEGKAAYLAFPKDYEGQIFGTLGYVLAKQIMDKEVSITDTAKEVYKLLDQQQPYDLHAMLAVAYDWSQYAMGENPQDWKGYKIVPRDVSATGGLTYIKESFPYMARHTWRSLGLSAVYKPGYDNVTQDQKTYEKVLKTAPFNAIGTFLRFSDRGLTEKINARLAKYHELVAIDTLEANKRIRDLVNDKLTLSEITEVLADPKVTRKKIGKAAIKKTGDPYAIALSKANKVERAIIMALILEDE